MKPWMKLSCNAVKVLVGLSIFWITAITWDLVNSIEMQISLLSQSSTFVSNASSESLRSLSLLQTSLPSTPSASSVSQQTTEDASTPLLSQNADAPIEPLPAIHNSAVSNNNNNNNNNNNKKRHLVIHIGPEKTASTTLQKDFYYKFEKNEQAFAADNYRYMGRYTTMRAFQEMLLYCPGQLRTKPEHPCYPRFLRLLDDERWRGMNMLLSEEVYSQAIWDVETVAIVKQKFLPLLQERWDISVVAVYRRFHDWLVSARKQRDAELPQRQLWPHEGGEALDSWKEVMLLRQQERFGLRSHYLPDDLAQWQDLNVSITVLNMHHPTRKITEQFVCDFLPDATNTCEFYRSNGIDRHANARSGLEYFFDNIVYAAAVKGIFDTTKVRRANIVKKLTKTYATISNMPLICPSSAELEKLLQESIHWEQFYAPGYVDLEAVKTSFDKLVRSNQFCRVDTDLMLEGISEWSHVLQKLGSEATATE